ncbi:MAG: ribosome biogenesis GTPase Der [Gammaproteobacteria bacterium]|nr:ribosome biogenesis GTPase Der [Gammaproteobacteria bacterium]
MKPVIALVGRPNVGKSTLFNRLTRSRAALVSDYPGLTRDRNYGGGHLGDRAYIVVDTGGLSEQADAIDRLMVAQALKAVEEADTVVFLVDARDGLTPADEKIAARLRASGKPLVLAVNKAEGLEQDLTTGEFARLGIEPVYCIASAHGTGVEDMMEEVLARFDLESPEGAEADERGILLAIVGRPNVGKSTLLNRMLGEERVLAFDQPGTTRDSIYVPFERDGVRYTLIDTAGVRRRGRVHEAIEKFSVIKTLQAIGEAHVVLLVLDAQQGVAEQDAKLLGHIIESGKALLIGVNKWDGLSPAERTAVKSTLERKLAFIDYASIHFISALHGSGVGDLFASITAAYHSSNSKLSTPMLSKILERAVERHAPPLVRGRRIKLRYAHQGGHNPPLIVIHGTQTQAVPDSYRRYLEGVFRDALELEGTPVRIEFKTGANPYKDRPSPPTAQQRRRRRGDTGRAGKRTRH